MLFCQVGKRGTDVVVGEEVIPDPERAGAVFTRGVLGNGFEFSNRRALRD